MRFLKPVWRDELAHGRRGIAKRRLMRQKPKPLHIQLLGGHGAVLVHKSTRKPGWWQATFFDEHGDPYADSESQDWAELIDHIDGSGIDWRTAQHARADMFPNPGDLDAVSQLLFEAEEAPLEDFAAYYPASASGALAELLEEPAYADDAYPAGNVVWIGTAGRMVKAAPAYLRHIEGNIFDPEKLSAVVAGVRHSDEPVVFYAPYGQASRIDLHRVKESLEYADDDPDGVLSTGDDELDAFLADPETWLDDQGLEPGDEDYAEVKSEMQAALAEAERTGEGDLGQWQVTVRDGNHRAFGALVAGEPFVWVMLADNDYQHLVEGDKDGRLRPEERELLRMLE